MGKRKSKTQRCVASVVEQQKVANENGGSERRVLNRHVAAAIVILIAVLVKIRIDDITALGNLENSYDYEDPTKQHDTPRNDEPPKYATVMNTQQQGQTAVDPSKFGGTWSLVRHFSKNYDLQGLYAQLKGTFDICERAYNPANRRRPAMIMHPGAGFERTTRHKMVHDLEQFDFFLRTDLVGMHSHGEELFRNTIPKVYRKTLERLDQAAKRGEFDEETEVYKFTREDREIMAYYNRALFLPNLPPVSGPLLTPMLLSTIWYEVKTPRHGRYIGAYINDGMYDPMMSEIAFDLHKSMPRVMKDHHLKEMWSYKYESASSDGEERTGIHIHADDAMVNVNLWITPDEANIDPKSGGLVVYTVKPPREWDFKAFNSNWEYVDEHLLRPSNYANVTIPYKQNRAVIFDSFLFHKSQPGKFKQGYENRRINLTFLYGEEQSKSVKN